MTHIIVASLRMDPTKNTGNTINTIDRLLGTIENDARYKGKNNFTLIKQEGDIEPVYLYKINY